MRKVVCIAVLALALGVGVTYLLSVAFAADTLYVPNQYGTIQAALNAASNGDTIMVADGTYTGANNRGLDFDGKEVTLKSENGPDGCIIDCQSSDRAIYFCDDEDENTVVDGFTMKNGSAAKGGAIYCNTDCSPTIQNCIFENNSSTGLTGHGGAIHCYLRSSPKILNCTFSENTANKKGGAIGCDNNCSPEITDCLIEENVAGTDGGGIWCYWYSDPTITNCVIKGNEAGNSGGGIHYQSSCDPTIKSCEITGNQAGNDGGGCCFNSNGLPTVINCLIAGNTADDNGGGIYCYYNADPTITNCTIADNSADHDGGGLYLWYLVNATVNNSIIWSNDASNLGDEFCLSGAAAILHYSCYGNSAGDVYKYVSTFTATDNCITDDPTFIAGDPFDYRLDYGSPCIDTGSDALVPQGIDKDLDGWLRKHDGNNNDSATVDMGCYEFGAGISDDSDDYWLSHPLFEEYYEVEYTDNSVIPDGLDIQKAGVYPDGNSYTFLIETEDSIQDLFDTYGTDVQFTVYIDTNADDVSDRMIFTTSSSTGVLLDSDFQSQGSAQVCVSGNCIYLSVSQTAISSTFYWSACARYALSPGQAFETPAANVYLSPAVDIVHTLGIGTWLDTNFTDDDPPEAANEHIVYIPLDDNEDRDYDVDGNGLDDWLEDGDTEYSDGWRIEVWRLSSSATGTTVTDTVATLIYKDNNGNNKFDTGDTGGWSAKCPSVGNHNQTVTQPKKETDPFDNATTVSKDPDAKNDNRWDEHHFTYMKSTNKVTITNIEKDADAKIVSQTSKTFTGLKDDWKNIIWSKEMLYEITTESPLPEGTVGVPYEKQLEDNETKEPASKFTWEHSGGTLPPNMEITPAGKVQSKDEQGPTQEGNFTFKAKVTYESKPESSALPDNIVREKEFTIKINEGAGGS